MSNQVVNNVIFIADPVPEPYSKNMRRSQKDRITLPPTLSLYREEHLTLTLNLAVGYLALPQPLP